uniref:Uncharacterized protein n=1 Tax=Rhizophora mucronata TaxID=61149 RepID=A0A2P2PL25_RHIMU
MQVNELLFLKERRYSALWMRKVIEYTAHSIGNFGIELMDFYNSWCINSAMRGILNPTQ